MICVEPQRDIVWEIFGYFNFARKFPRCNEQKFPTNSEQNVTTHFSFVRKYRMGINLQGILIFVDLMG